MAIREGLWDCRQCGTTGILGRHKICTNCGHPRPADVRFYLPDDAPVVSETQATEAKQGADWLCEHCGASNPASRSACQQCNALRGSSESQQVRAFDLASVPRSGDNAPPPASAPTAPSSALVETAAPAASRLPVGRLAMGFFLLVALLCACSTLLNRPREVTATVTDLFWERTIAVEALRTVTEEGWQVPTNARLVAQRQEIHHSNQVLVRYETRTREVSEQVQVGSRSYVCGQRDLGNGYFEDIECEEPIYETRSRTERYDEPIYRAEPVYQTKYTYELDRWGEVRTERASRNDGSPHWPELELAADERQGTQGERYVVYLTDAKGTRYDIELPYARWRAFAVGQQHTLKVSPLGGAEVEE